MPRIYVNFSGLNQIGNRCESSALKINSIRSDFQRTVRQLDWEIRFESDIEKTALQLSNKLEEYSCVLQKYRGFIDISYNEYIKLESYKKIDYNENILMMFFSEDNLFQKIMGFDEFKVVNSKEQILSKFKSVLDSMDQWGDVKETGVIKNVIEYFENLTDFFSGDKKGLEGAGSWCDLADSSIGVWTGLYDYYNNMSQKLNTGLFSDIAQRNVKVVGVEGGILGLLASTLNASSGLDEKKWQSIVADYVDCGKDMISVLSSGYSLKHIGDTKSLLGAKAGPWNAVNVYSAIGEAGLQAISQGFRSHEKYYMDGKWDLGDTGATGVDISMAGIYGLSHSLTLGLDDIIFGAVDSATGGDGTETMSYYEKAAEGYKFLANECAKAIGNWWTGLFK